MKPAALLLLSALFAGAAGACTVGQGEVDVTETRTATFPGVPAPLQGEALPDAPLTTDAQVTLNLKKDLAPITDLGKVTVDVSKNALEGSDLSIIRHIKATIATEDGTMPAEVVSDVDVPAESAEVDLPLLIDGSRILAFLTEGPVTLHLYLTGTIPEKSFALQYALVAHLSVDVNGAISKL